MTIAFVDADPDAGFNYPYYLHTPDGFRTDESQPILVEPTNTGYPTDEFQEHVDMAEWRISNGSGRRIADELSVPFLHPVFPRPVEEPVGWTHYVHGLDAETMEIEDPPLERVDLQLLAMVTDARERLSERGYHVMERFIMNGFSAAGVFANRFAALHPDRLISVSAGGINMALLPIGEFDLGAVDYPTDIADSIGSETLPLDYHVGIANIEELTGDPFDLEAFREVNQFLYRGEDDDSDSLLYPDAWTDKDLRRTAVLVYGPDITDERFPCCASVYDEVGAPAIFRLYGETGHRPGPAESDIVEFHKRSLAGDDIEAIRIDLGGTAVH